MPDPTSAFPHGERRRWVRQKLHTPVYASFNGPETGMVVDLSELLDLHEEGFAVQTSERLEMNGAVTLCLDLPETRSYIHGSGQVIWSDDAGRGGIRFSALSDTSRQILKEWLFANLLIACSNHVARTAQLAQREQEQLPGPVPVDEYRREPSSDSTTVVPMPNGNEMVSAVEAVRSEIRELGDDEDAIFQLITERALWLTGASGGALAFLTDDRMLCRARAGEPAPPLESTVEVKHGLSGECIRTGLPVRCEDTENDPRVDPEVGRALGIRSLIAAPIVSDFRVVGLLEVFSPYARGFAKVHETVLELLVEVLPKQHRRPQPGDAQPENIQVETAISPEVVSYVPRPPALESDSIESDSIESGSIDLCPTNLDPLHATREASWDAESAVRDPISQRVVGQFAAEPVSEQVPDYPTEDLAETPNAAPSRLLYRALLGLVIVVVAMVLGYLVGPMIEKRWAPSPQAAQRALAEGAGAASTVSLQRPQVRSLTELRDLADHGDPEAQWQMGVRYHNGEGVPQDDAQAMLWFQLAGEQGNVAAQSALGAYYWAGRGVQVDLSKAYIWSMIALAQGDENSKVRLEGLASQMTRRQVSAARQQAEEWIRQHNSAKPASD